jgi:hypothetical protein
LTLRRIPTLPSQRSIFAPTPTTHINPSQRHLHRPVQPSPLRVQANSPATTTTHSLSSSLPRDQSKSHSQSRSQRDEPRHTSVLGEQNKLMAGQGQSQSARSHPANGLETGERKIMAPLEGIDNIRSGPAPDHRRTSGKMGNDPYAPRLSTSKGNPDGFTPSPRVRIVSADSHRHQGEKSSGSGAGGMMMRSKTGSQGGGTGHATMGDLTGLTGMLATPAKGLLYRRLGEDGERSGQGCEWSFARWEIFAPGEVGFVLKASKTDREYLFVGSSSGH